MIMYRMFNYLKRLVTGFLIWLSLGMMVFFQGNLGNALLNQVAIARADEGSKQSVGNEAKELGGENDDWQKQLEEKQKQITELEARLKEISSTKKTLNNQISYFDNQIKLTGLQILQTEDQIRELQDVINQLSAKIEQLDIDLDKLSSLLVERIVSTYKQRGIDRLRMFLAADGFADLLNSYKYIRVIQIHDKEVMEGLEQSRQNYDQQKQLKLEKQTELTM